MLWNLGFRFVSVCFTGARHFYGSGYAVSSDGWSLGCGLGHLLFLQRSSLMLGHRLDACASHLMRCTSYVMPCASCLMFGHCLDACASCVEPGTPWVTEASSFAVIFHFFPVSGIILLKFIYLDFAWIYHHLSHDGSMDDVVAVWTLC